MRVLLVVAAALALAAPVGSASRRAELFVNALDTRPGVLAETDVELSLPGAAASVTISLPAGYTLVDRRPGSLIGSVTLAGSVRATSDLVVASSTAWQAGALTVAVEHDALVFAPPAGAADVDLDLRSVLVNPPAPSILTWRATVTPASGTPYELRSIVGIPQTLTLRSTRNTLGGRLLFAGRQRPGVNVHLDAATRDDLSDERELGVVQTRADGRYLLVSKLPRGRQLLVIAYVNFYDAACLARTCSSESIAPPPATIVAVGPA